MVIDRVGNMIIRIDKRIKALRGSANKSLLLNDICYNPIYDREFKVEAYLGQIQKNDSGYIMGASGAKQVYSVTEAEGLSQSDFVDVISTAKDTYSSLDDVLYFTRDSFAEDSQIVIDDLFLLAVGYVLIAIFACLYVGRIHWVHNRIWVGFSGFIALGFSLIVSIGLSSYSGYVSSPIEATLPYLLIGIMVDNMFVLVGSLASACRHGHGRNIEEQIGHALEHGGLSILVTSFTDIIALGIGALTTLPLVATFCVQITIGIFGNLVFVFTFFTACLAIDQRRVNQSRNGILCCIVHDTPDKTKARLWQSNNLTKDFIDKYYAPFLNLKPVKVIVILITLGMFGAMTYGWTKLEYYTEDEWWVDEDSDSYKYLTTQKEYFPDVGVNVAVYLGHNVNYYNDWHDISELCHEIEHDKYTMEGYLHCWPELFRAWLIQTEVYNNYSSKLDPQSRFPTSEDNYNDLLSIYLNHSDGKANQDFITFDAGRHIVASKIPLRTIAMHNSIEKIESMESLLRITHETGYSPHDCFPFALEYFDYELNEHLAYELEFTMAVAAGCVIAMTFLVLASPIMAVYMSVCISIVLVDVMGAMYYWEMTIDAASSVVMIQAIGFAVDYCIHISESFLSHGGSRENRMKASLGKMDPACGLTSFAVLLPVFAAKSYIYTTFYKVFLLVWIFGLFHGLVFLPVLLSLIGPRAYLTIENECKEKESKENKSEDNPTSNGSVSSVGHHCGSTSVLVVDTPDSTGPNGTTGPTPLEEHVTHM
ncbi:hypothetical protein CAPTEDRAFT_224358 [Capitella teleta]|uniref:SSD domain-containing protein n=1 Tax=Capitella teleta TaxID=283909 RepID=R7TQN5_CAPTE|nr:hypothetical protein CAPTEDRAFT_224358 [Capitella teleta]|eukprot:ELT93330.1 hypothetical protein CAPTEDRAFT_224358 [Capitella teleta]